MTALYAEGGPLIVYPPGLTDQLHDCMSTYHRWRVDKCGGGGGQGGRGQAPRWNDVSESGERRKRENGALGISTRHGDTRHTKAYFPSTGHPTIRCGL